MSAHYSNDFRNKIVNLVKKGMRKSTIAKQLEIGRSTIDRWLDLKAKFGSVTSQKPIRKGQIPKINNLDEFKKFADANRNLTQKEMAEQYGNVSRITIGRALRKIGYTRKKRATYIQKAKK
jgi:transposase